MAEVKCPVCKCLESTNAEVCRACGAALHDHTQNEHDQKIVTKAKCTACGCLESASAEVCRACGAALQPVSARDTSFAQVIGGFFSWLMGGGFHEINEDSQLYEDNISQDSDISAIFECDPFIALGEGPVIQEQRDDVWTDPAYSSIEGNIYHVDFK